MKCVGRRSATSACTLSVSGSDAACGPMKTCGSHGSLLDCTSRAACSL